MKILRVIAILLLVILLAAAGLFLGLASTVPRLPDDLRLLASSPATEVYGRDGELLGSLGGRQYVSLDQISPWFQKAVVAVEDRRFYAHRGIDHLAMVRALGQNLLTLGGAPGGSTITQQLAKNLFFSFKRSWKRKLLEAMAAVAIENRFSKEEILETYCNFIDFGQGAYGVKRAAQLYFGKHAAELTAGEAALLAAVPNAPSRLNPFTNLDQARRRQRQVLLAMARAGTISEKAADSLAALKLKLSSESGRVRQGSFPVDQAVEIARDKIGSDVVSYGGVRIYTGVDPFLQQMGEKTLAAGLNDLEAGMRPQEGNQKARLEGALVAIDVASGQVAAMVGGRKYSASTYNRAVKSLRQPGSAFKPVIYLTALESGSFTPVTLMDDHPLKLKIDKRRTWSPVNFDRDFRGQMTLKFALMKSINTIAAQLIDQVGPERVVETAHRLGITAPLEPHLSLALGSQGVTPLELASAYATIAREGVEMEPLLVKRVETRGGELLMEKMSVGESRFAPETVYQLIDMMEGVLNGGTGSIIRARGFKGIAFGKTGTSSDHRDAWFAGGTSHLVVVVWVGYDDNSELRLKNGVGVTGTVGAAPIWADFMIRATAGEAISDFPRPIGMERVFVSPDSGLASRDSVENYIPVVLKADQAARLLEKGK